MFWIEVPKSRVRVPTYTQIEKIKVMNGCFIRRILQMCTFIVMYIFKWNERDVMILHS